MRINIHHYHHFDAEATEMLSRINRRLSSIEETLNTKLEEILEVANTQEQQLNTAIESFRDEIVAGFQSIRDEVQKTAQRVIQRLKSADVDLSEEIGILQQMQTSVRQSANDTIDNLQQIAVSPRLEDETTPATKPTAGADVITLDERLDGEVELRENRVDGHESPKAVGDDVARSVQQESQSETTNDGDALEQTGAEASSEETNNVSSESGASGNESSKTVETDAQLPTSETAEPAPSESNSVE